MKKLLFLLLCGASFQVLAQDAAVTTTTEANQPEAAATATSVSSMGSSQLGLFSAGGPDRGEAVWGVGALVLVVVPMLDVNLAYGATEKLSIEARASLIGAPIGGGGSIGLGLFGAGARYQIREGEKSTLSLRGNALLALSAATSSDDAGAALSFRVKPGVLTSWEKPRRTFSLGLDVPVSFVEGSVGTTNAGGEVFVIQTPGVSVGASPSFSIEKPLENRTLYSQLGVETLLVGANGFDPNNVLILPYLSVGLSW